MEELKNLIIRTAQIEDYPAIRNVHDLAFQNSSEGQLVGLIHSSSAFVSELSIVAEINGTTVGHILFSKIQLFENNQDLKSLSLAPVAVIPTFQKSGIGEKLIREGIQRAKKLSFHSILVLGDPHYYKKFGFVHELTLKIQSDYACKDFMGLELVENALANLKSAVAIYPKAFSIVD